MLDVLDQHRELSNQAQLIGSKAGNMGKLKAEIDRLDKVIGKKGVTGDMVQQGIVSFSATKHPVVSLNELSPMHLYSDENFNITTSQVDLTGGVNQLLDLGYDFEKNFNTSKITSMRFYTTGKNNVTETLHLKLIFQNYESNK
jgi:hypothetical protein